MAKQIQIKKPTTKKGGDPESPINPTTGKPMTF